ncbi:MAG: transcriptional regulator NrdR [Nanoarchaeota archaeon]|nr:transcriptional regulator NrdR [Nanoarchaeota archaeon]MBU4492817.1 transcriptional regulator NrdR [Nanoarchaeota archaeon]
MKCPYCNSTKTKVTDKRDSEEEGITRRRRECLKCKRRFTTYERPEIETIVVKKDKRREPYNRDKLTFGLVKACEKRPISHEKIEKIVNEIEERLRRKGREVKSEVIGKLAMQSLKKLDKVAYIRFASVYSDFQDLADFKNIFKDIMKK